MYTEVLTLTMSVNCNREVVFVTCNREVVFVTCNREVVLVVFVNCNGGVLPFVSSVNPPGPFHRGPSWRNFVKLGHFGSHSLTD
jgi:hypothetical protein